MSHPKSIARLSLFAASCGLAIGAIALPALPALAQVAAVEVSRPAADKEQDAARKPGMMMKFARVKRGQTVVDILPGEGYFTRIFSNVVGPKGKVYATALRDPAGVQAIAAESGRKNIEAHAGSIDDIALAGSADVVWTSRNYHDLKGSKIPADATTRFNKAVFAALKPGGYYVVLDHSAAAGSGTRDVDTLHRIDAEAVKAEVLAAGFVLDGESKLLANAADARDVAVFDAAIKGKTDQFVLRFKKPK